MNIQIAKVDKMHQFAVNLMDSGAEVNLTQMAKPFGKAKQPIQWLRTEEAKSYIKTLSEVQKCSSGDLLIVRKGNFGELPQGTWANDYRIALRFAQWLSPEFSIAVDEIVLNLLVKNQNRRAIAPESMFGVQGVMLFDGYTWYPYTHVLRALGYSTQSGSIYNRPKRHPSHFYRFMDRWFVSDDYVAMLKKRKELETEQKQLELFM
ncbi:MAG: KilA-N domain-containing protein [Salinivirgaceae bacterium]|nr:KilA-N domain-containing protein [Salinivirgaceae bacterium]MDY0280316.1 KilA-N domain-containing protein [Salinivirgaceae bacterium]